MTTVLDLIQEMASCEFVYFSVDELTEKFKELIIEEEE